jgi:hypothetical protein
VDGSTSSPYSSSIAMIFLLVAGLDGGGWEGAGVVVVVLCYIVTFRCDSLEIRSGFGSEAGMVEGAVGL